MSRIHKETGYLAAPYDAAELAVGIEWCTEHGEELTKNCLEKTARDFDGNDIIARYSKVYEHILNVQTGHTRGGYGSIV